MIILTPCPPNLAEYFKRGCINRFAMMWRTAKRRQLMKMMIAVSITILLSAFRLSVTANGPTDGTTFKVIANITVGRGPWGIAYDPSNGYIYVTDYDSNTVSVIDGATNTVIANITVGSGPAGVAYDPSNGYIYVADSGSDTVSVIDGKTNKVIATIPVGSEPAGVAYDPSNGYIYVTNYGSDTVSIISTPAQATKTYTVTFTESSLPAGTQWSVTFNGLTKSSTANIITFTGVLAGNYTWNASLIIAVGSGTRYVAQTSSGTISVPTVLSVSLYYVKQYRVTIQPTAGGSTSPSGTFWYNAGSTINITAIPAPGYEFVGWETNSSITFTNSSSATTNAIINSPGTIVALFKAIPSSTYIIEYVAAAVIVVIAILVAVLLIRRRK